MKRGFTLIELLVVIAIIGVLASIVLVSLSSARTKALDAARISDVKSLKTAMELYNNDNGGYPTSNGSSNGDVLLSDSTLVGKLVPKYMPSMPSVLISDSDRYYSAGITTGISPSSYSLLVYVNVLSGYCRTGVNVGVGDWGSPPTCNF
ncbi:MAG TPA: prepilin-type N-terminal cleavage/methylation domain-containing protein [Candidatus Paceibacterota bacterium]|nr:prepilin-type N-terminal cleavage/methylation domain-containing protein [Candidatus Paceibacterota bacterium]